jgi:hypothetical protein
MEIDTLEGNKKRTIKNIVIGISGPAIGGPISWFVAPYIAEFLHVDIKLVAFAIMVAVGMLVMLILRER